MKEDKFIFKLISFIRIRRPKNDIKNLVVSFGKIKRHEIEITLTFKVLIFNVNQLYYT